MNPTEYRFPLHHSINRTAASSIQGKQNIKAQAAFAPILPGVRFGKEETSETFKKQDEVATPPRWHRFLASIPLVNWVLKKCSTYFKNAFAQVDAYWKQEAAKPKGGGYGQPLDDAYDPMGSYLPYAAIGGVGLLPVLHHPTITTDEHGIHPAHYGVTDPLHGDWGAGGDFGNDLLDGGI